MKLILLAIALALALMACTKVNQFFGLKDDNPIEQKIESIILQETGIELDLTPEV